MTIKVAVIGAGSLGFTRKLVTDILTVPELADTTFALTDINRTNLRKVARLLERDIQANGLPATVLADANRRRALADAGYVINVARVGGLEAFAQDIDIPLKYGVDQCVGDTLCAGGIMYGQRNIPVILDFCRDIREVARPGALLLNYANPNAMNTWAANLYGDTPTLGLCHGVQGGHVQLCQVIELLINKGKQPGAKNYKKVEPRDVDIICAGINHQTWYIQVLYDGEDWARDLVDGFERHPVFRKTERVRIDMLKRFGYYSTESNGHLSEYVPWYRKRPREIRRWIDLSSWIHGETGGYLRHCTETRSYFEEEYPALIKGEPAEIAPENRSLEHGSYIIEALETGRPYRGHFNVVNDGCITNLPDDSVVEVPGYVDRNGVSIPQVGDLPLGCAAICGASISVQRLAVEAAVRGDVELLKQAMLLDPLTGAVCDPPEIDRLTDEMLVAQAKWLPQYKKEIPKARKRLAAGKPLNAKKTKGAARLTIKTPAELREARK